MTTPRITPFVLGDYQTNCYVVTTPDAADDEQKKRCWIVDVGYDAQALIEHVQREGLTPVAILLTHAHMDHIASLDAARSAFNDPPVYLHEAERGWCSDPQLNLSAFAMTPSSVAEPDRWLKGGEELELNGTSWRVIHLPGHSPGGVAYVHDDSNQAIVGDTLFAGSVGRMDFPTSNPDDLEASLKRLMELPDDVSVHPGHGPSTTIGRERTSNPFILHGLKHFS